MRELKVGDTVRFKDSEEGYRKMHNFPKQFVIDDIKRGIASRGKVNATLSRLELISSYLDERAEDFKKARKALENAQVPIITSTIYSLGNLPSSTNNYLWVDEYGTLNPYHVGEPTNKQEQHYGDKTMYFHFDTKTPLESQQIDFAFNYANDAYNAAHEALNVKYKIYEPEAPKNAEEFIERIKKGEYTLLDKEASRALTDYICDEYDSEFPTVTRLRWRTEPADKEGHLKAKEALDADFLKLKTVIMAGDYKASIEAVDKFKAKYVN